MTDYRTATRIAYDTVAVDYAELLRDDLATNTDDLAALSLFADAVKAAGGGPVLDVGCGPGRIIGRLVALGLDASGVDLSPRMIDVARRDHPSLTFAVGDMTALDAADGSLTGVLVWYSIIHIPEEDRPRVAAELFRVLAPGGVAMLAFQVGTERLTRTSGYGHPIELDIYRIPVEPMVAVLEDAGFVVDPPTVRGPNDRGYESTDQAYVLARRPG